MRAAPRSRAQHSRLLLCVPVQPTFIQTGCVLMVDVLVRGRGGAPVRCRCPHFVYPECHQFSLLALLLSRSALGSFTFNFPLPVHKAAIKVKSGKGTWS